MNAALLAQTWVVLVTGLGGTPLHQAGFEAQAVAIAQGARARLGVAEDHIIRVGNAARGAELGAIGRALSDVAARAGRDDMVLLVLLGHGSAVSGEPRFHLPGPDLTAAQLATMLAGLGSREVVVINTASASGPWIEPLAGPRRAIITATRSANERDETTFGRFLAAAFAGDTADTDKNGRLSVLELFEFARQGVERHYREARRLRTENALLETDGDGRGVLTGDPDTPDGRRASLLYLNPGAAAAAAAGDATLAALLARRDSLERAIAALRSRRASLDSTAYERQMEGLLVRAAETGRDIRARERP